MPKEAGCSQQCVPIVVGVSGGSLALSLLMSLVAFFFGIRCRPKEKEHKLNSRNISAVVPESLIYEEIAQVKKCHNFELTYNSSYGEALKL